jgi:hypothetical protein
MNALRNTATLPAVIPALLYVHFVAFSEQIATTGFAPRLALAIPEHSEETLSAAVSYYRQPRGPNAGKNFVLYTSEARMLLKRRDRYLR